MSTLITWQEGRVGPCRLLASISVSENSRAWAAGLFVFSRTVYGHTNRRGPVNILINYYSSKHKAPLSTHRSLRLVPLLWFDLKLQEEQVNNTLSLPGLGDVGESGEESPALPKIISCFCFVLLYTWLRSVSFLQGSVLQLDDQLQLYTIWLLETKSVKSEGII